MHLVHFIGKKTKNSQIRNVLPTMTLNFFNFKKVLYKVAEKIKNFAVIYLVDISQVSDFNKMYELYDPCTVMFFYRNKHIMIDLGTGNNNKINTNTRKKAKNGQIFKIQVPNFNGDQFYE